MRAHVSRARVNRAHVSRARVNPCVGPPLHLAHTFGGPALPREWRGFLDNTQTSLSRFLSKCSFTKSSYVIIIIITKKMPARHAGILKVWRRSTPRRYTNHVTSMSQVCHKYVTSMSKVCHKYVRSMSEVCHKYVKSMSKVCHKHVTSASQVCQKYVKSM